MNAMLGCAAYGRLQIQGSAAACDYPFKPTCAYQNGHQYLVLLHVIYVGVHPYNEALFCLSGATSNPATRAKSYWIFRDTEYGIHASGTY